jgi:hypothetical protein
MKAVPQTTPNASEEVLIERRITFRNSTFGALKTFIRDHKRRTGQQLSNAAAVDIALRSFLAKHIHPSAVAEMARLSRAGAVQALQSIPQETADGAPPVAVVEPRTIIAADVQRPRRWIVKRTLGGAA